MPELYPRRQVDTMHWRLSKAVLCHTASPTSFYIATDRKFGGSFLTLSALSQMSNNWWSQRITHNEKSKCAVNQNEVAPLRQYASEHQRNSDLFLQQLRHAYKQQCHRPIGMTPFSLFLACIPPGQKLQDLPTALPHDESQQVTANCSTHKSNIGYCSWKQNQTRRSGQHRKNIRSM